MKKTFALILVVLLVLNLILLGFRVIKPLVFWLIIGVIVGTIGASLFVSWYIAFFGSLIAMILESLDLKIRGRVLDDNVLVPLVAAIVMSLI